jgi:TP901 family phage tail tape measure protein
MTTPDATATARLIFDASSIRTGVNQANQSLGTLYEVVRNNWWGIRNIGDAFSSVGGAISAGMTVAVSSAAEFESSMATVSRTTYDATQSMEANAEMASKLGDQLKQLAETNPIDLKTITGVAASAGALGIASQDVAEFTKTITQFASVTDVSADTATSSLAKIANVFNLNASQFKNLGSAVYDVGVNTAATESQILNMATRLAPFAAAAGLSAAETVGLSAAVQSLGPRAEAGASALQHLLAQLAKVAAGTDPKKLQELADVAGVSADEFS